MLQNLTSIADMAKVRPPTYFCGPWTFFCYVEKKHISSINTNLVKNCTHFFSKGIKRTNFFPSSLILLFKHQLFQFFFTNLAFSIYYTSLRRCPRAASTIQSSSFSFVLTTSQTTFCRSGENVIEIISTNGNNSEIF